ncbi:MAG: hypothetical protein WDM92_05825 [Caulobacteraceae bacterium]
MLDALGRAQVDALSRWSERGRDIWFVRLGVEQRLRAAAEEAGLNAPEIQVAEAVESGSALPMLRAEVTGPYQGGAIVRFLRRLTGSPNVVLVDRLQVARGQEQRYRLSLLFPVEFGRGGLVTTVRPLLVGTAAAAAALAGGLGWVAPGRPAVPVNILRAQPARSLEPLQPPLEDEALDVLADYLVDPPAPAAADGGDPSPAAARAAPRPPPPPPPPPPPDVAVTFRRGVSAIVNQGREGLAVLVVDSAVDGRRSRLLRVGDEFADGWRIAALSSDEAVLAKGDVQEARASLLGSGPARGCALRMPSRMEAPVRHGAAGALRLRVPARAGAVAGHVGRRPRPLQDQHAADGPGRHFDPHPGRDGRRGAPAPAPAAADQHRVRRRAEGALWHGAGRGLPERHRLAAKLAGHEQARLLPAWSSRR